jgi:hypothetical protein
VVSPAAEFELARQLRSKTGAPLGDVFSFVSGLYFRGKITYAMRFAAPADERGGGVHIITPNAGLRPPDMRITRQTMLGFAAGDVDPANPRYRVPLEKSARALAETIGATCDVVLLGSVATPKYAAVLTGIFGDRLRFPADFVGRGDMSRGGLLLRKVREGAELEYLPIAGAVLHGSRPPKLPRYASAENPA